MIRRFFQQKNVHIARISPLHKLHTSTTKGAPELNAVL